MAAKTKKNCNEKLPNQLLPWRKHLIIPIIISIFYLCYQRYFFRDTARLSNVLTGLLQEEQRVNLPTHLPIAVGFGSCLDLFVNSVDLMKVLKIKYDIEGKYHESINTLDQFSEMFVFFFSQGAAAERFLPKRLFDELIKATENLNTHWAGGGNAPVISGRFLKAGFKNIYIGGAASEKLRSYFPSNLRFSHVSDDADDIHLIMEYDVGDRWGKHVAPRANRFIVHSDLNNPFIRSLEEFHAGVVHLKPRLIVVGALQMLDNFPFKAGEREERMSKLAAMLNSLPNSTLIHFEMASFSEVNMVKSLLDNVFPFVDSVGMNEQELPNLISVAKYGVVTQVANANPRVATVLDDLREVYKLGVSRSVRGLTRIHVHTLAFQAILVKHSSQWENAKGGSAMASLIAHRHVCGVEDINLENARLIMDDSFSTSASGPTKRMKFNDTSPISCWDEDDYEICVAPVLVCTDVKQTAGGGDNITPAGLIPQI